MKWSDNDVIYVDNHILIAVKPPGVLTQPDNTGRDSLEELVKAWLKEKTQKKGAVFLHPIHRLDRFVSGLVLFARTSKALSRLNEQLRSQQIQRIYVAEIEGILPYRSGQLDHFLIHKSHHAEVVDKSVRGAKRAKLFYEILEKRKNSTLVKIELETGRYHQIRAQFAKSGFPVVGDGRYGAKPKESIHLHCFSLSFIHPVTKELLSFKNEVLF